MAPATGPDGYGPTGYRISRVRRKAEVNRPVKGWSGRARCPPVPAAVCEQHHPEHHGRGLWLLGMLQLVGLAATHAT